MVLGIGSAFQSTKKPVSYVPNLLANINSLTKNSLSITEKTQKALTYVLMSQK